MVSQMYYKLSPILFVFRIQAKLLKINLTQINCWDITDTLFYQLLIIHFNYT